MGSYSGDGEVETQWALAEPIDEGASSVRLASRSFRFFATVFDFLIAGAFGLVTFAFLRQFGGEGLASMAFVIIVQGTWLSVNAWMLARSGQTMGKSMIGICIERTDGSPAGFRHAFLLRYVLIWLLAERLAAGAYGTPLDGVVVLLWLADLVCIFRADRRCLHDWVADTRVVYV